MGFYKEGTIIEKDLIPVRFVPMVGISKNEEISADYAKNADFRR